jgi:hypothetical protein
LAGFVLFFTERRFVCGRWRWSGGVGWVLGDAVAVRESAGVDPVSTGEVSVAFGVAEAGCEPVKGLRRGVVEADVVASGEVAGEFLRTEDGEDGSVGVGDEGHSGLDEDVGAGLEPPWSGAASWPNTLVRGEEGYDSLGVFECLVEDIPYIRAGAIARADELIPLSGLQADGAEPVE